MELGGVRLAMSQDEAKALVDVANTLHSSPEKQDNALSSARASIRSRDSRYALALYQLEIGRQRKDDALRAQALDALIASDRAPADKLVGYLGMRGGIAFQQHDLDRAGALWSRQLQLKPNDPETIANLAQVKEEQGDAAGAAELLGRVAGMRISSHQKASEIVYRQWVSVAYNGHLVKPTVAAALALLSAYPSPSNWRYSLSAYRQLVVPTGEFEIDLLRLMRAAGSLTRPEEYLRLAQLLEHSARPTEARAVLDDGISHQLLSAGQSPTREILAEVDRFIPGERARVGSTAATASPTQALAVADSLAGAGRLADAIALYRSLPGRPGIDAAQVNTHVGMALLAAGRAGEAEASFRSAAADSGGGADQPARYADLASFWLARLAQPGSIASPGAQTVRR